MIPKSKTHSRQFREIRLTAANAADLPPAAPRSARMPIFIGAHRAVDAALDALRVMIVGNGSVGGAVAMHLARLQIKELRLVDPSRFKRESFLTHLIDPKVTGSKALHWGRLCKSISPATRVYTYVGPVEALGMCDFAAVDLVVMATDNLAAEVHLGQRCIHLCKPLLQASVYGDALVAQVRLWQNHDGSGPCPRCAFGEEEELHMYRHTKFTCGGNGPATAEYDLPPTMSVSFLCNLAADLAMTQLLRLVLKLGAPLQDSILEYCGYTHKTTVSPLRKRADCPCEHFAWNTISVQRPLHSYSLKELAETAINVPGKDGAAFSPESLPDPQNCANSPTDLSFLVGDDLLFVQGAACCGSLQPVQCFCRPNDAAAICLQCGAALRPQSYYSHRPVASAALGASLDRPLNQLGAGTPAWVLVRCNDRSVLCKEEENGK